MKKYIFNLLIALDQLLNTILTGYPDETISARLFRLRHKNKVILVVYRLVNVVFYTLFNIKDHCRLAYLSEFYRKDSPNQY